MDAICCRNSGDNGPEWDDNGVAWAAAAKINGVDMDDEVVVA
eukprot:CAMPEP_0170795366 /NCGR_PEP_ID=MMETSP0733-20121128/24077_1 /TAXON_ID=186038 /ORGANISM="Fragilariopsis kerguelensis, Strain L26-C5" /LENGTH=41 /DNA_ID= /DNA_START= /DNA_END= /DNA_ORIENTATION=